jgi:hypothetical protein
MERGDVSVSDHGQEAVAPAAALPPCVDDNWALGAAAGLVSFVPHPAWALVRNMQHKSSEEQALECVMDVPGRLRLTERSGEGAEAVTSYFKPLWRYIHNQRYGERFVVGEVTNLNVLSIWAWLLIALMLCGVFWWIRRTVRVLFLTDRAVPGTWEMIDLNQSVPAGKYTVIVGLPRENKSAALKQRSGIFVIDLAKNLPSSPGAYPDWSMKPELVVLDSFSYRIEDPAFNSLKLQLLEHLVYEHPEKRVLLISNIDPLYFFVEYPSECGSLPAVTPSDDTARWARVLCDFKVMKTNEDYSSLVQALTDPARRQTANLMIWSTLAPTERLVLYQLANGGWVNPKNSGALHHLQRRGLVSADPVFKIATNFGSLREICSSQIAEKDVAGQRRMERAAAWEGWKLVVTILLFAAVAGILLFVQQDILAAITSATGALKTATKLISDTRAARIGTGIETA